MWVLRGSSMRCRHIKWSHQVVKVGRMHCLPLALAAVVGLLQTRICLAPALAF